jgi:hypothetical protein
MTTRNSLRLLWAVSVGGALLLQLRAIRFAANHLSEDQALLWASARAWGDGSPQEWEFWGQRYGTTLESIGAEVLRWIGIPLRYGLPITTSLLALGSWWVLAAAATRGGRHTLAALALIAPLAVTWRWTLVAAVYNTGLGRLAACLAVALALTGRRSITSVAFIVSLAGLAMQWDASSGLLLVPLVRLLATERPHRRWRGIAIGLVPPSLWFAGSTVFASRHPDRNLHPSPPFDVDGTFLESAWDTRNNVVQVFAPGWWAVVAVIAVIVVLAIRQQAWHALGAVVMTVVLTQVILLNFRSHDGRPTPYFEQGRTILLLPMALWLCAYLTTVATSPTAAASATTVERQTRSHNGRADWFTPSRRWSWVAVGVGALVVARLATATSSINDVTATVLTDPVYPVQPVSRVLSDCAALRDAAGADRWVIVRGDRTMAYACGGIDPNLNALFTEYERRTWLLYQLDDIEPDQLAVWSPTAGMCDIWSATTTCTPSAIDPRLVRIDTGDDWVATLEDLGIPVRPFGPNCNPQQPTDCR